MKTTRKKNTQKKIILDKNRIFWLGWGIILGLAFFIRLVRLNVPTEFYFDEVYHSFTAKQMLVGDKNVYDPWAVPPKGVAFEWTHPPLAKLLMAFFMGVFGENAFGWRFGSALFGTLAIFASGLLAFELFRSKKMVLIVSWLLLTETLLLAMSRIGMNDVYFLFFGLMGLCFYVKTINGKVWRNSILATLFLGMSLASKWTALYLLIIIMTDMFVRFLVKRNKKELMRGVSVVLVGGVLIPVVYLLSYFQMFEQGYSWSKFLELQKQMWGYHTNLKATHGYQSQPWQWILNLRPVWFWVDYSKPDWIANIYNLGNSVVCLIGLVGIMYVGYLLITKRKWKYWFVLLCYFMLWLPWVKSPRIMFFYHYLPAIPFLTTALGLLVKDLIDSKKILKWLGWGVVVMSTIWLVVFYPNTTGLHVPIWFAEKNYFVLPGWR